MSAVTRREYLLVDGHSVIFAWPELRALHTTGPRRARAREELIRLLTFYQDHSEVRVVVAFDGQGAGKRASEATEPGGIQIFYAPAGSTADAVIERLAAKYAGTHRLIVATGDNLVQQTAITFGAEGCLSPEGLWGEVDRAVREAGKALAARRRRQSREPGGGLPIPFPSSHPTSGR